MPATEEQLKSIEDVTENKLIVALPGSGKTFTTVSYVDALLKVNEPFNLKNQCLMVTFTNSAAAEMANRLKEKIGKTTRGFRSSTFAGLFMSQFRPISKGRSIIMGAEQEGFVRRTLAQLKMDTDELPFWKSRIDELCRTLSLTGEEDELSLQVYRTYISLLQRYRKIDLNGVSVEVVKAMQKGTIELVPENYLMVDEFQDSDSIQYEWIKVHGLAGKFICVVGDDDQSIYSWRGSQGYENMVRYQKDLDASAYLLSICFRCAKNILAAAEKLIRNNVDRIDKEMNSGRSEAGEVSIIEIPKGYVSERTLELESSDLKDFAVASNGNRESKGRENVEKKMEFYRFVAQEIAAEPNGWAVLARTNSYLDLMERALAELNVKVKRIGGRSIFDNEHAVGIVRLFYALAHPKATGDLSVGLAWLGEKESNVSGIYNSVGRLGFSGASSFVDSSWLDVTRDLQALAAKWKNDIVRDDLILEEISKFRQICRLRIRSQFENSKQPETILEVCTNILLKGKGTLADRASNLVQKLCVRKSNTAHRKEGVVTLATMNGSKGLEWPKVWITDVEKGKSPMIVDDGNDIANRMEEERRLLFVAMTRAEDKLVMSYGEGRRSEFLDEIEC